MDLLVHVCCAPCLIYPLEKFRQEGFRVSGLFYNPNIHPFCEYNHRKSALEELAQIKDIQVFYSAYQPKEFFRAVNNKEEGDQRCRLCWQLRLRESARFAREKGFQYFSSTLLVSPYQNQEVLREIGNDIAKEQGVDFYYRDLRCGFKPASSEARDLGLYRQKYCGCIYSEIERFRKKYHSESKT